LADYWLYKTDYFEETEDILNITWNPIGVPVHTMEMVGITGGIIKVFQVINNSISRSMIWILKKCVAKENRVFKNQEEMSIENIVKLKRVESANAFKTIELSAIGRDKGLSSSSLANK